MALSARDLYFAVRVEDRATRPLRRIANDMRALGRTELNARQRTASSAKLAVQRAEAARRTAASEFMTSRRLAIQNVQQAKITASRAQDSRRLAASNYLEARSGTQRMRVARSLAQTQLRTLGLTREELSVASRIAKARADSAKYSRIYAAGGSRNVPLEEARLRRLGANKALAAARQRAKEIEQVKGLESGELSRLALLQQQEVELAATESRLANVVRTRGAAYRLANQRITESELRSQTAIRRAADGLRTKSQAWRLAVAREREAAAAVNAFPIQKIQTIGNSLAHAGRGLTFLGAAATAMLGFAAKSAADFSTQVTIAATQSTTAGRNSVAAVQKNAAYIQNAIQNMLAGGKVIAGPADQTSAVYRIFSGLTLKGSQLSQLRQGIQLLREFNRVTTANAGLVTLEEATRAGIILINRFGVSTKNIRPSLNTMQAAVRFGDMTMSEFIGTLNQMAPASQAAGYSFTQMSGAAAFLSRQFPSLRQGATGYARLLEVFSRKDVIQGLRDHHVEITKTVNGVEKLIPLNQIAHRVIDGFGGSIKRGSVFLQNFFKEIGKTQGTIQARKVLESYVHRVGLADTILRQVTNDHKELEKSLAAAQASPGVRWAEFTNQLKALSLEIGAGVIPALGHLAGYVRGIAQWFNRLSPNTKKTIGEFALFTSVAMVLSGILLTVVGGLLSVRIIATQVAEVFGLGLGAAAGSARIEVALLLGAVVALSIALQHFHGFREAFGNNIGPIVRTVGLLLTLRLGIIAATTVTNLLTAASIRFGLVGLASMSAGFAVLIPYIGVFVAALIGLQVAIGYLENEMANSVQYYQIVNGHVKRATKEHEKEARAVGEATANYNDYLRVARQVGSIGPAGPIVPGGGIRLHPARGSVTDHGDSPRFGFGKTIDQATQNLNEAKKAAQNYGVAATVSFTKAYLAYKKAAEYVQTHPTDWRGLERRSQAAARLESVVGKERAKAMEQAFRTELKNNQNLQKVSDARIMSEARNVQRLERIAKNQKTFAAWKAYYAALTKLQKDATDAQLQAAQQTFTDASVQKLSDARIVAEARNVHKLERIAKHQKTFDAWKAYYRALAKLQTDATDSQLQAAQQLFDTTGKKVDQATNKMQQKYQQVLQNIKSQYDTFYSQNQNLFGQLFQGPYTQSAEVQNRLQFGAGPISQLNKNDVLKDLRSQVTRFRSIRHTIDRLQRRGLPSTLLQQIESLGPEEAQKMLKLINQMTPTQIKEYSRLWRTGQKEVHDATMRDVKAQLKEWRRHGRRIGLAIAAGLRDENTVLEKSLRGLITSMFPELAGKNKKTPPKSTPGRVRSTGDAKPTKTEHHVHYHPVVAPHDTDMTIKKQLAEANWHHRTRQK